MIGALELHGTTRTQRSAPSVQRPGAPASRDLDQIEVIRCQKHRHLVEPLSPSPERRSGQAGDDEARRAARRTRQLDVEVPAVRQNALDNLNLFTRLEAVRLLPWLPAAG